MPTSAPSSRTNKFGTMLDAESSGLLSALRIKFIRQTRDRTPHILWKIGAKGWLRSKKGPEIHSYFELAQRAMPIITSEHTRPFFSHKTRWKLQIEKTKAKFPQPQLNILHQHPQRPSLWRMFGLGADPNKTAHLRYIFVDSESLEKPGFNHRLSYSGHGHGLVLPVVQTDWSRPTLRSASKNCPILHYPYRRRNVIFFALSNFPKKNLGYIFLRQSDKSGTTFKNLRKSADSKAIKPRPPKLFDESGF